VTRFRHDADNPLVADVVVVDEASMVDLAADESPGLGDSAKRAGSCCSADRDQLSSVEAGAVLAISATATALERGYSNAAPRPISRARRDLCAVAAVSPRSAGSATRSSG